MKKHCKPMLNLKKKVKVKRLTDGQHRLVLAVDTHARSEVMITPLEYKELRKKKKWKNISVTNSTVQQTRMVSETRNLHIFKGALKNRSETQAGRRCYKKIITYQSQWICLTLSTICDMPRLVRMYLAWMSPYSISAACSTRSEFVGFSSRSSSRHCTWERNPLDTV